MEGKAVDLDDDAVVDPQEVDLVSPDRRVRARRREPGGADQRKQPALGFGFMASPAFAAPGSGPARNTPR